MSTFSDTIFKVIFPFIKESDPSGTFKLDELNLTPLIGGSQASLYRFNFKDQSFVLRLLPPKAQTNTRMHQISLAEQAGEIGIGPKIHFVDPQLQGMIMEFIPGRTVVSPDFENQDLLIRFAHFINRLHKSKTAFPLATSPFQRFRDFYLKIDQTSHVFLSRLLEVKIVMEKLESFIKLYPTSPSPTHLDLHPLNIMISNGKFVLVDWVNGGLSDPFFDLATFTVFQNFNDEKCLSFLSHYFGRNPTPFEWNRFILTQPIRLFVIAAALLSFNYDKKEMVLNSLEEAPSLKVFVEDGRDWSHWKVGLTMLKAGLELIDESNFRSLLKV